MDLINQKITHNIFGEGDIIEQDKDFITAHFDDVGAKTFVYPNAFRDYLTLNDEETAKKFEVILVKREKEEAALNKIREEEREQRAADQRRRDILRNHKIHESSQIVFWLDEETDEETEEDQDKTEVEQAFADWQVFTGVVQSGKSKGEPNRAARLRPNSAALLTIRGPEQEETERKILGLYMVTETFSGNLAEDGIVPAHEDYRIKLSDEESEKMLFWNYYINKNYPHRTTWNSGKYRYYDNVWTAQMLKDIIALRTDEEEVKQAKNFLEYFCKVNAIDIENIPEAEGALKQ